MPIRLLATDLDGTLLGPDRRVSPANRDAVRRCVDAGIHVVLASGRNISGVAPHAEMLGLDGPLICCNGAHVFRRPGEELLHRTLPTSLCHTLVAMANERRLHLHFYSRERLVFLSKDAWGALYLGRLAGVPSEVLDTRSALALKVTKAMFVADPLVIASLHDECATPPWSAEADLTLSEPEYLEFLPRGANKGTALQAVAEDLAISRHHVAAIGDYLNDLPMLAWAGLSAAVGNAEPSVREAAQIVVGTNQASGVADFIDSYVINGRE